MAALASDFHQILIVRIAAVVAAIIRISRNRTNAAVMSAFVVIVICHNYSPLIENICRQSVNRNVRVQAMISSF